MSNSNNDSIPSYFHMTWPTVISLRELGGSGTIDEIDRLVITAMKFSEHDQSIWMPDKRNLKINYRLAWARTHLKGAGLLENSARGVWSLTSDGLSCTEKEMSKRINTWRTQQQKNRNKSEFQQPDTDDAEGIVDPQAADSKWRSQMLEVIVNLPPDGFERLCQRLLREAGFRDVKVVGKSGDNGIDVVGTYKVSLISFQTYVQCKRYSSQNSVGSGEVRNFRGSMRGIGDKGLFITTSRFTQSAEDEANRSGVEPIELIDGSMLCDLLKQYSLGATVETVEQVTVIPEFFDQFA